MNADKPAINLMAIHPQDHPKKTYISIEPAAQVILERPAARKMGATGAERDRRGIMSGDRSSHRRYLRAVPPFLWSASVHQGQGSAGRRRRGCAQHGPADDRGRCDAPG